MAFLHGEVIVGWLSMGTVAVLAMAALALWWWKYPPRSPILPTTIYLLAALPGLALWMGDSSNLLLSSLGFALTLPWSAFFLVAVFSFEIEIPVWAILPGIPLNGALIYFAARSAARRRLSFRDAG